MLVPSLGGVCQSLWVLYHMCMLYCYVLYVCVVLFQEVEPRVGEKLCRLWATVEEKPSGSGHRLHNPLPRDHSSHHHQQQQHHSHHHSTSSTSTFTPLLPPGYPPPFPPHMAAMFADGRPPQIHMNPALYPPPRLGPPSFYWGGRPPRNFHGPSKRYSFQHRARGRTSQPRDSPPLPPS